MSEVDDVGAGRPQKTRSQREPRAVPPPMYLRAPEVAAMLSVSPRTLRRMVKANRFPAPVMLHDQVKAWPVTAVQQWSQGIQSS